MDAYWIAFYSCCEDIGVKYDAVEAKKLATHRQFSSAAGWLYTYEKLALVCERPELIKWDDRPQPRLHCETGPALKYRDGFSIFALNGVVVTEQIVTKSETLTAELADAEKNAEVRRIIIERMGAGRYLKESGAVLLHEDFEKARKGAAPRALFVDKKGEKWLVGRDGSTDRKAYYMPVPNDVNTCEQAHRSICGFDESLILAKS